jgi:transcriptional regulator GlxA family with amidase domain
VAGAAVFLASDEAAYITAQTLNVDGTIVNCIAQDVVQPLSAAQLAAELGMSESRFSRFFRRATVNTFTDFVNRLRVNRACHLLMESERLVTHICDEVGFNNVANFNRRFLEIKGMTPSEFRRQADRRFGRRRG